MRPSERSPRNTSGSGVGRASRLLRLLKVGTGGLLVSVLVGFGVHSMHEDSALEVAVGETGIERIVEPLPLAPRSIPEADGENLEEEPHATEVTTSEQAPEPEEESSDAESDRENSAMDAVIVEAEEVPDKDPTTLSSGGATVTVATVSGTGTIPLGFTRSASSAAPNLPTYVSAICDGESVYSAAFNTTTADPVVQEIPFSGSSCSIRVKVAQPSPKWAGTSSSIVVTEAEPETHGGTPYVHKAGWTSNAVSGSETFGMEVPDGFDGTVTLKLTACSSRGGTSDETKDFACGDLVQKDVGSQGVVTVSDGKKELDSAGFDISAATHHDMVSLDVEDVAGDQLTITVEHTGGSAILVHGPGSGAVGTH